MIPLIAMQLTDEVKWSLLDFIIMGAMLSITGLFGEVILKKVKKSKHRFTNYYKRTTIPIMMISGNQDELFDTEKLEESYNLISSEKKKLILLEETHTSIIWRAGSHINNWLADFTD